MLQDFVDAFFAQQNVVKAKIAAQHPSYDDLVRFVVEAIRDEFARVGDEYSAPNPDKIHCINDGDYQGTLLYIVPSGEYQPSTYYYTKVSYGSCSGCDTLKSIHKNDIQLGPNDSQQRDYFMLALHIVQHMKEM